MGKGLGVLEGITVLSQAVRNGQKCIMEHREERFPLAKRKVGIIGRGNNKCTGMKMRDYKHV